MGRALGVACPQARRIFVFANAKKGRFALFKELGRKDLTRTGCILFWNIGMSSASHT